MREFGEELLDKEELIKQDSILDPNLPFKNDPELRFLKKLFDDGYVENLFLGCTLDCITLKPEILTLLIVDGDQLTENIKKFKDGWEGKHQIVKFNRIELIKWLNKPNLLPAAAGCLALALRHYEEIEKAINTLLTNA